MDKISSRSTPNPSDLVFSCYTNQGAFVLGKVSEITSSSACLEIFGNDTSLIISESLSELTITMNGSQVYKGSAVIQGAVTTGLSTLCTIGFEQKYNEFGKGLFSNANDALAEYSNYLMNWCDISRIDTKFKIAISNLQLYLKYLYFWLTQSETSFIPDFEKLNSVIKSPSDAVLKIEKVVIATLNELFGQFEKIMLNLDKNELPLYQRYIKTNLHSLVLCAPFAYRTYFKPLGYAGDYEMINMIVRNGYEGHSLYAILINRWFLNQAPAIAHRNRIEFLTQKLVYESLRFSAKNDQLRVLNLGCGPAFEIQDFVHQSELSDLVEFTLFDFNEETIQHTRSILEQIKRQAHRKTTFHFKNISVQTILRESISRKTSSNENQYDYVYCAGLFDYLSDAVCQRLIEILFAWLKPGGLLLITNVDASNPRRHGMESVLDWNLVYRNSGHLTRILPSSIPPEASKIHSELSGINLILEIRKASHV